MSNDRLDQLELIDRWWRAANYLSVGQIYLRDNPLLARPIEIGDVKPRLLGHWGTCPGINLVWAHVNRCLIERNERAMFVCGPGHGGPAAVANPWLEGTYGHLFPDCDWSVAGMRRLFEQFSFPGGVPSHAAPETPGSIHEGGELGYALAHAYGASFDAPTELVVCMVGDGEAETGPTAASWHSHRFVNPGRDGAVLPVLHLNGYKIANPTLLARLPETELLSLFEGYGYLPTIVSGDDPATVHEALARALDDALDRIGEIRVSSSTTEHGGGSIRWPMLVLRTPKGWTGPDVVEGEQVEGTFRAHQVPIDHDLDPDRLVEQLDEWLRSYRPSELFTADGRPHPSLDRLRPATGERMSDNPRTNPGLEAHRLELPDPADHQVRDIEHAGPTSATGTLGPYLRDTLAMNPTSFRLFGPDEVESNRLSDVFDETGRTWLLPQAETDEHLSPVGRVMEVLSEHLCQGWLEGYLLTGRHGVFTSYEAFIHIVDSMFNQHAKWLDAAREVTWRRSVPSLTYLLSSHVWRQDHNGFSHQDPGFLDVVCNKKPEVVRVYLPPDANSLLVTMDHCLREPHVVNVVVAGKQPEPGYLGFADAVDHFRAGAGIWQWAGTEGVNRSPDVVLACAGDVPTMEAIAASELLADHTDLVIRLVNVIDLTVLQAPRHNPRGLAESDYDDLFPPDTPTVFAFHGYPWLVHRLTYDRANHGRLHVHGFIEEGTTTTPFDMAVRNRIDRFHLAMAAIDALDADGRARYGDARRLFESRLEEHADHVVHAGEDLEDIAGWRPRR